MMKNEQQVCSLELAKEMAALGIDQDSIWCWTWIPWNDEIIWSVILQRRYTMIKSHREQYAAYTVAELGEMLPAFIKTDYGSHNYLHTTKLKDKNEWIIAYYDNEIIGDTEANARAKCLIYMHKKGILKYDD